MKKCRYCHKELTSEECSEFICNSCMMESTPPQPTEKTDVRVICPRCMGKCEYHCLQCQGDTTIKATLAPNEAQRLNDLWTKDLKQQTQARIDNITEELTLEKNYAEQKLHDLKKQICEDLMTLCPDDNRNNLIAKYTVEKGGEK